MKAAARAAVAALRSNAAELLILAGVAAVAYGAWIVNPAAGFITGGVELLTLGVLVARLEK